MTIKNLKKFLKDKYPHIFRSLSMYEFKGCKIAIDCSDLAYRYWSPQQGIVIKKMNNPLDEVPIGDIENSWLNQIWSLLSKFIQINITPVMIFDGTPPEEKIRVIEARRVEKDNKRIELQRFEKELSEIPIQMRTQKQLDTLKEMKVNFNLLSSDQFNLLKIFLNGLGLPVLQAKNEAEELCCTLCREGYVTGVYCEDSDCLAHLCPCWIFGKSKKKKFVKERNEYMEDFEFFLLRDVLNETGLSKESFIDLCIMSECDYNSNIYNFAIGGAYKALKEYKTIEGVMKSPKHSDKDFSILNYETCRKLFAKRTYSECCEKPDFNLTVDINCYTTYSQDYLFKCNMLHAIDLIRFVYPIYPKEANKLDFDIIYPVKSEELSMMKFEIDMSKLNL